MRVRSAVVACVVLAVTASVAASSAAAPVRPVVTGFQSESDPLARIDTSARALDVLGVDGVSLNPSGTSIDDPDASALDQLARAHRDHLRAEFLVSNFSDAIDDFSEPLAWRLLGYVARRRAVAARIAQVVRSQGWDGVNVDLESLSRRDTAGLVDLLRRIRADLPRDRTLAVDVMADGQRTTYPATGYDVPALASTVDDLVLMTYDQHGPWENTPGPVGSLFWMRKCLAAFESLGAPRSKIDLGVAGYGYAWRPHSNDTLTDSQARRLVAAWHARPRWDSTAAEWTATLRDGSVVWWSDTRSYRARYELAVSRQLHGVAVWSLGQSDPIPAIG